MYQLHGTTSSLGKEENIMSTKDICQRLINTHKDRIIPKNEYHLTEAQKNIFNAIKGIVQTSGNPVLRYRDIKSKYKGGLLPTDFCYNLVNIAPDFEVKLLFSLNRGTYEFVDFNWDTADNINITWSPNGSEVLNNRTFTVGHYRNGKYEWYFKELEKFL